MPQTILLTSFATWQPHQQSNSSDDLLEIVSHQNPYPQQLHFLRQIPVDFNIAPSQLLAKVDELQPSIILCCGMAESRCLLTVESNGKHGDEVITTPLDLESLIAALRITAISHDAGQFVCNWLYYSLLKYCREQKLQNHCLFVHVPVLTPQNLELVVPDFLTIMQRLLSL
ncbi:MULTISPECIES: peptidase C15 [Trichocoleus]|uniref:Peptidase C15 n=1 Tax=Trichocoleus desertorum GB2-A4 TaxID=2933944 RepID=A0ABV0J116_9CYAN|nr:peptidase C15 [Trichocoleus sp. FACHB-46]MBD1860091.1 peptidase C15 [Trichocoleus sp. FACHB-46]